MDRLKYLILSLLFISCNIETSKIINGDTGVVTNISSSGNWYVVTMTVTYKVNGAYYHDNLTFYTKEKYNINDTIKFSRK